MSNPQMQSLEQGVWGWIQAGGIKHRAPIGVRICKAFLAGIFLSLGGTLVDILTADPWFTTNAPGLLKIIQGLAFPVGLIMVVIFQADLVTTQMAIGIASTMKRRVPLWSMLVDIPLVFLANLAGALAYAGLIVHYGGVYTPAMATGAAAAADAKVVMLNFRQIFLSSIGCNFCVCAAVFMAFLANDIVSKIFACYGPIFCFVSCGYNHIVANAFLIPVGLMTGQAKFGTGTYIWKSIIASALGNFVGAAILILPLVYMHGRDDQNPSTVSVQEHIGGSPSGTFISPKSHANDVEKAV